MTKGMLKRAGALGFAAALLATPAVAQDAFVHWNKNDDAGIDNNEFATGFGERRVFDRWDADASGDLGRSEFGEGYAVGGDGYVRRFGAQEGVWNSWDADGNRSLTEREFNEGVFTAYDENQDGMLDENEYGAYRDDGFWAR